MYEQWKTPPGALKTGVDGMVYVQMGEMGNALSRLEYVELSLVMELEITVTNSRQGDYGNFSRRGTHFQWQCLLQAALSCSGFEM